MTKRILIILACVATAYGQTSKTPIYNGILQTNLDANGFSIVNLSGGATGTVTSITATTPIIVTPSPLIATGVISLNSTSKTNWDTAYTERNQWDGGSTGLVAATARTSLALVIGTNVEAWDTDLDVWATKTPYAGTVTVTTGKTFNATGTLTYAGTDGSTLNIGTGGTLGTAAYTASTAYQGALTNSAGLRGALSDENGTGAALFSGATTPDFTTGLTVGGAAATGKVLQGDGTKYAASTPTWPTTAGTAGYTMRSDGTNVASYPQDMMNSSTANQTGFTSDQYLTGSNIVVAAGDFKAKGQYRCLFDMGKTGGTGAIVISLRIGTAGTTADTAQATFNFGAGTAVADSGTFEVVVTWRTVGGGSSATVVGFCRSHHNLITTGLYNNSAAPFISGTITGGFNSTTATNIGLSFNGGSSFGGTNSVVQASLLQ